MKPKPFLFKIFLFVVGILLGALLANVKHIQAEIVKYQKTKPLHDLGIDFVAEANSMNIVVRTLASFQRERSAGVLVLDGDDSPTIFFQSGKMLKGFSNWGSIPLPNDLMAERAGGIKSIFYIRDEAYILYSSFDGKNCYRGKIVSLDSSQIIYQGECLDDISRIDFNGLGGGWARVGDDTYLSVGAPEGFSPVIRPLAQDKSSFYGKVWKFHKSNSGEILSPKIFALGFKNPQGLAVFKGQIFAVDHGPRGGDEVNLVKPGKNYGWPKVSYGTTYGGQEEDSGRSVPYPTDHSKEGFEEPLYTFIPSVGLTSVAPCPEFIYHGNCLLLLSLKQTILYAARMAKNQIVSIEPLLETPHRLRHFARNKDGSLYVKDRSIFVAADWHGLLKITFEERIAPPNPESLTETFIAKQGKSIYQRECSSCHNINPAQVGATGPSLKGASRRLLQNKILHGTYPYFYTPQRTSSQMPTMPLLENDINALYEYLK